MKVLVPASSANLGPGFDCFGIAWQCYNEMEFELCDSLELSGCESRFCNEDNLAWRSWCAALESAGKKPDGARIRFGKTDIPVSRGMGSSAALIVGAITAANELNNLGFDKAKILEVATKIEGHPDNIAPALFGGFTVSTMAGDKVVSVQCPLSDKLFFTLLVPDFELSTLLSRSVLPESYPKSDAIFNLSRASLLIKALEIGDSGLISVALEDKIHQPYRAKLIKGYEDARTAAHDCGAAGMCISGAGSTLLCISDEADFTERMAKSMSVRFPGWKVLGVKPDIGGAKII